MIYLNAALSLALVLVASAQTGVAQTWTTNGNNIYYNAGTVGIGTTSPTDLLHLSSASGVNIRMTDATNSVSSYLTQVDKWSVWQSNRNPITGTKPDSGRPVAGIYFQVFSGDSSVHFQTSTTNGADPTERMVIDKNGSVGIGTTPGYPLHLVSSGAGSSSDLNNGTLYVSNTTSLPYGHAAVFESTNSNNWDMVALFKSGFVNGVTQSFGVLKAYRPIGTNGNGNTFNFSLNNSAGIEKEYGGFGAFLKTVMPARRRARWAFMLRRGVRSEPNACVLPPLATSASAPQARSVLCIQKDNISSLTIQQAASLEASMQTH